MNRAILTVLLLLAAVHPLAAAPPEGFGRFGRYHDDGLLTLDIWPDRAELSGITIRFASSSVVPAVASIDQSAKVLHLPGGSAGDATQVRYTLLYPGFVATFGADANLRLSRDRVTIEPYTVPGTPVRTGLLLRPSAGSFTAIGIAFADGLAPDWTLVDTGSTSELRISQPGGLGEVRFFTPGGPLRFSSAPSGAALEELRSSFRSWVPRGVPTLTNRSSTVDFDTATVTLTETFVTTNGEAIAPIPPVLAFAMGEGYAAESLGTLERSSFPTRQGEFAWVAGDTAVYTLPIPPLGHRGHLRPVAQEEEVLLLNDMTSRLGASWATNAVDLGYVGMTPAQQAWPMLNAQRRSQLANAWASYLPFAFRLPPYEPSDPRKTWIEVTEPLTGLQYIYTYAIAGGPGNGYLLDIEWGNMLPVYGLGVYAAYTGDWSLVRDSWPAVAAITRYTDLADDWAWMTTCNGDMGWSTGTGDPMTAAFVGHVAALRMAREIGDDGAARHHAVRAARVAVPAIARFWYTDWAREQGFINSNQIVQGFWEKGTFTATTMSENQTDPWGPTNPLSGNGCQPEFFSTLALRAPAALRTYEDRMLAAYPNLFDGDFDYSISTLYGGNSVYVTFPHI